MKSRCWDKKTLSWDLKESFGPSAERGPGSAFQKWDDSKKKKKKVTVFKGLQITWVFCKPLSLTSGLLRCYQTRVRSHTAADSQLTPAQTALKHGANSCLRDKKLQRGKRNVLLAFPAPSNLEAEKAAELLLAAGDEMRVTAVSTQGQTGGIKASQVQLLLTQRPVQVFFLQPEIAGNETEPRENIVGFLFFFFFLLFRQVTKAFALSHEARAHQMTQWRGRWW